MELFSKEIIEYYKPLFSGIKVVAEVNKIIDAVNSSNNLTHDETIASLILAYQTLKGNGCFQ